MPGATFEMLVMVCRQKIGLVGRVCKTRVWALFEMFFNLRVFV